MEIKVCPKNTDLNSKYAVKAILSQKTCYHPGVIVVIVGVARARGLAVIRGLFVFEQIGIRIAER